MIRRHKHEFARTLLRGGLVLYTCKGKRCTAWFTTTPTEEEGTFNVHFSPDAE